MPGWRLGKDKESFISKIISVNQLFTYANFIVSKS